MTTVEDIVRKRKDRFGQAERVWVMDRGMVSEANIDFLRQPRALCIVGIPKSQLRDYKAQLAETGKWVEVEHGVEARLVEHPEGDGQERFILCRCTALVAKERAKLDRQMTRLSEDMLKIARSLRRSAQKDLEKIGRPIGRWLGKYPATAQWLNLDFNQRRCVTRLRLATELPAARRKPSTSFQRGLSAAHQFHGN